VTARGIVNMTAIAAAEAASQEATFAASGIGRRREL
jgi:hypothetical protein